MADKQSKKTMTKSLVITIAAIVLCSCFHKSEENTRQLEDLHDLQKTDSLTLNKNEGKGKFVSGKGKNKCTATFINNEFSNNIIDVIGISKSGIKHIFKSGFKLSLITSKNAYEPDYIDSIYTISYGNSWLEIKAFDAQKPYKKIPIWIDADIKDKNIRLFKNVSIGMPKKLFFDIIRAKYSTCDTIKVDTDEQSCDNFFIFKNDFLTHIMLNSKAE